MSLGIHASVIALLILISSHPAIRRGALDAIDLAHSRVVRLVAPKPYRGGGGGGQQDLLPASRGRLPKFARRHFTPPSARPPEVQAVLVIEPTLIGPSDVKLPDLDFARLGDPLVATVPLRTAQASVAESVTARTAASVVVPAMAPTMASASRP